jgi:multidrug efflux pump subunit AcrA (membrane-fusion protein)
MWCLYFFLTARIRIKYKYANNPRPMSKILSLLKAFSNHLLAWSKARPVTVLIVIFLIFAAGGLAAQSLSRDELNSAKEEAEEPAARVKTVVLDLEEGAAGTITAAGTVAAEASLDIVALNSGTARDIYFEVGDKVAKNKVLARRNRPPSRARGNQRRRKGARRRDRPRGCGK